jgi:hypothetical protein
MLVEHEDMYVNVNGRRKMVSEVNNLKMTKGTGTG